MTQPITYNSTQLIHNFTDEKDKRYIRLSPGNWLVRMGDSWEYVYTDSAIDDLEASYRYHYRTRAIEKYIGSLL